MSRMSPGQRHFMCWVNTFCGGVAYDIKPGKAAEGARRKGFVTVSGTTVALTEKGKAALRDEGLRVHGDDPGDDDNSSNHTEKK